MEDKFLDILGKCLGKYGSVIVVLLVGFASVIASLEMMSQLIDLWTRIELYVLIAIVHSAIVVEILRRLKYGKAYNGL